MKTSFDHRCLTNILPVNEPNLLSERFRIVYIFNLRLLNSSFLFNFHILANEKLILIFSKGTYTVNNAIITLTSQSINRSFTVLTNTEIIIHL